jgi:integrase
MSVRETTAKTIEHLRAVGNRLELKDTKQPGLRIRKCARNLRNAHQAENELITYRVVYKRRSDNKTRQVIIGKGSQVSLKEARQRAAIIMGCVAKGEDPASGRAQWRASDTFEGLARQWIGFKRRQGRATSYMKRSEERLAILPESFRATKACDVKRVDVTATLDAVAKRGAKTETNRQQALISAVFKWAVSEGLLEHDPTQGIKRRFDEAPRERVLTDKEVRDFWYGLAAAPGSEAAKIAMRLCFVLGQRPKEIAHLRRDKISLDGPHPTATILKETAKNRTEHVVPLPRLAVSLLREALTLSSSNEWAFPNPECSGPIDPHAFANIVYRARDQKSGAVFGIVDAQLYDAKKTIATFLGDTGHPDQFIGLLFNHLTAKSGTVTGRHYNHAGYLKQKREMIELWAQHLETVLDAAPTTAADNVLPLRG